MHLVILLYKDLVQSMLNYCKLLQRLLKVHLIDLSQILYLLAGNCSSLDNLIHLILGIPELNLSLVKYLQSLLNAFALVVC